jgi:hypothetical protein
LGDPPPSDPPLGEPPSYGYELTLLGYWIGTPLPYTISLMVISILIGRATIIACGTNTFIVIRTGCSSLEVGILT